MKKIKQLKKIYQSAGSVIELSKKTREFSYTIKKSRKEADETHRLIQEKARQSQTLHEEILKISDEIDRMKVEEEESFKKFAEFKQKFTEVNNQLKEKLKETSSVRENLDRIHTDRKEKKKHEQESILKSKEEQVNEKIRKGEKLTTEDLLVFQGLKE